MGERKDIRMKFWRKHKFKILVGLSVCSILVLYYMNVRQGAEGTWSLEYSYNPDTKMARLKKDSKGETECRRVMEKLFKLPFPNRRPHFLMNNVTGKPLEIDCCNLDLQLGVEYNGKQHYEYVPAFHKNEEAFKLQLYRDEMKKKLCEEHGFILITVPYTIPVASIENFLIENLQRLGYALNY